MNAISFMVDFSEFGPVIGNIEIRNREWCFNDYLSRVGQTGVTVTNRVDGRAVFSFVNIDPEILYDTIEAVDEINQMLFAESMPGELPTSSERSTVNGWELVNDTETMLRLFSNGDHTRLGCVI